DRAGLLRRGAAGRCVLGHSSHRGEEEAEMRWQLLPAPDAKAISRLRRAKRSRFLIDESLGSGCIEFFQHYGMNAVDVWQVGLVGRDDPAVFAFAWKQRRILLTHDEDFLDDRLFPEH